MDSRRRERRPRKRHPIRTIFHIIGRLFFCIFTLSLIGVCTAAIFAGIFWTWVQTTIIPAVQVNADDYTLNQSSIIYYKDPNVAENDGWVEYKILHDTENRILVDYDEIPPAMWEACVAIEDHRFFEHEGVDWKRTGGAVMNMFFSMRDTFGGSTITQQLLKNMTEDNKPYVSRKVREIFRALEFEKNYTKQEILELYLNTIYFGMGCYGVQTAAQYYFGKDAKDLSVAECACIVAITNNPSRYGPMSNIRVTVEEADGTLVVKNPRELNKERQETILYRMYDPELGLNYLTWEEYEAAKNEPLNFIERAGTADQMLESGEQEWNTWFMDQVFEDVANDLVSVYGIDYKTAEKWIYNKGYRIYTTLVPWIQDIADSVYRDRSNLNLVSDNGQQIRSAITILEPSTGHIVAIVGDIGEKVGDRILSFATLPRQVGSSIKPLTVYSPALDSGAITPATSLDDYPVMELNGTAWPKNSPPGYGGLTTVRDGVRRSINTIAIRTLMAGGIDHAFDFAAQRYHLNLIDVDDDPAHNDRNLAALGLGGLTHGLTTVEMAGAYGAIANAGRYNRPRTYERVEMADGTLVLSNAEYHNDVLRPTTAYLMTSMLEGVVESGTGTSAKFSGMHIAGKTGTTSDNYDRYFVGYTPYYVAAVWTGYKSNARINYSGNPAITMWKKVMEPIHANLPDTEFYRPEEGLKTIYVCQDSGKLVTDACRNDLRGSRVIAVEVEEGFEPTESCDLHVWRKFCTSGEVIASNNCPSSRVQSVGLLDYPRENYGSGVYAADSYYRVQSRSGRCSVHGGNSTANYSRGSGNTRNAVRTSGTASYTATPTPKPVATSPPVRANPTQPVAVWDDNYDPEIYDPTVPRDAPSGRAISDSGGSSGGGGSSGDSGGSPVYEEPPPPRESSSGGSSGGGSSGGGGSGDSGGSSVREEPTAPVETYTPPADSGGGSPGNSGSSGGGAPAYEAPAAPSEPQSTGNWVDDLWANAE